MTTRKKFWTQSADLEGMDINLRNFILTKKLYEKLPDNFDLSQCILLLCEDPTPTPDGPATVKYEQTMPAMNPQFVQQPPVYPYYAPPPPYYAPQYAPRQKNNSSQGLITALILSVLALFAAMIFIPRFRTSATDFVFGNGNAAMAASVSYPAECTYKGLNLVNNNWGNLIPDPEINIKLLTSETVFCIQNTEYQSFIAQTNVVYNQSGDAVDGATYLGYKIINDSFGKVDQTKTPQIIELIKNPQSVGDLLFIRLPAINAFAVAPSPTAYSQIDSNSGSQGSTLHFQEPTPTVAQMQMQILVTNTPGPVSVQQVQTMMYYAENPLPTATLGPIPVEMVQTMVSGAQTKAAMEATPTADSLSSSQINSIMSTVQAQKTPQP